MTDGLGLPAWLPAVTAVLLVTCLPIVLATALIQEGASDREIEDPARPASDAGRRFLTWRNTLIAGTAVAALWGLVAAGWLLLGRGGCGVGDGRGEPSYRADRRRRPRSRQGRGFLLAADPQEATPDSAWRLVDNHLGLVPPIDRPYTSAQDRLLAASVLATLGLQDSAIAVVDRVRAVGLSDDRSNYPMAWASLKLGWRDSAIAHLQRFTAAYPALRPYVARDLTWPELRDDPRFEVLVDSM